MNALDDIQTACLLNDADLPVRSLDWPSSFFVLSFSARKDPAASSAKVC